MFLPKLFSARYHFVDAVSDKEMRLFGTDGVFAALRQGGSVNGRNNATPEVVDTHDAAPRSSAGIPRADYLIPINADGRLPGQE